MQQIIQFLDLLVYTVVVSQAFFYMLAMSRTVKSLEAESFVELRNLLDKNLQTTLRISYYSALLLSLVWLYFATAGHSCLLTMTAAMALIALMVDMVLIVKGNQPVNKIINGWSSETYPADWEKYREKWFAFYHIRQVAGIIGFICLLAGAVFG